MLEVCFFSLGKNTTTPRFSKGKKGGCHLEWTDDLRAGLRRTQVDAVERSTVAIQGLWRRAPTGKTHT